ncbi:hypothetical protein ABZT06_32825 [Streptomyces sp. NPDC005483]|uniref:hypothetical protein n=1 Tax=Streptomyces sp. NPDC005483 TaxID=3154882 RepID=UPI0033B96C53
MADEGIDNFEYVPANQCFAMKHTTQFGVDSDMDQMKEMVRDADPGTVKSVAAGWSRLEKDLVGPGGVKEILDTAVEHVMAHWEGQSADLFREQAQIISTKLTDSSKYAHNVSQSLTGAAAILEKVKPEVLAMEKPGTVSRAADFLANGGDRSGGKAADDAIKSGVSSQEALDSYGTSLSEGREAQLRMAAKMEVLGAAYNSRAAEMGSWKQKAPISPGKTNDDKDFPGDPGGIAPAPVVIPTELAPRSPQAVTTGVSRRGQVGPISSSKPVAPPSGVTGGAHKPTVSQPQVGTAIDGISGGRTGAPAGGVGPVGGGSAVGGGIGGGAGFVGGAVGGAAGAGAARGMTGRAGSIGGVAGAGAAARGGAARAGGAAGRSGGVVGGTPKAGAGAGAGAGGGRGTTGGSGLHSSRGAAARGGASAVRKGGVAGAPGSRTGRRKDDEQREGERPDYLVEDEETWTPQTNAAPRVIE